LKLSNIAVPIVLLFAAAVGLAAFLTGSPGVDGAFAGEAKAIGTLTDEGEMTLGAEDAPVTVIEYASMSCPHCALFHRNTFPDLKKNYIDHGKVRFIFREFPINKPALEGAMVARCAGPKRFFPILKLLFAKQGKWASTSDTGELISVAKMGGLTKSDVEQCLKNADVKEIVLAMRMKGETEHEVASTPTFIVNGKKHPGALSFERFEEILKPLLPMS